MKEDKSPNSDGFIKVTYKGKKNRRCRKPTPQEISQLHPQKSGHDTFIKTKIVTAVEDIKNSIFFVNFKESLECALKNFNNRESACDGNVILNIEALSISDNKAVDIVCYGLGSITTCMVALYQLAFLINLKDNVSLRTVSIYDPIFSVEEKNILENLGMNVLDVNEEGKRTVSSRTIFFMPHCDLGLYNNLLWANWNKDSLSKLFIIGNSFQQYLLDRTERNLKEQAIYVNFISKFVTEIKINNNFRFTDIFNNLSIHCFYINALNNVTSQVWNHNTEPVYDDDIELIRNIL